MRKFISALAAVALLSAPSALAFQSVASPTPNNVQANGAPTNRFTYCNTNPVQLSYMGGPCTTIMNTNTNSYYGDTVNSYELPNGMVWGATFQERSGGDFVANFLFNPVSGAYTLLSAGNDFYDPYMNVVLRSNGSNLDKYSVGYTGALSYVGFVPKPSGFSTFVTQNNTQYTDNGGYMRHPLLPVYVVPNSGDSETDVGRPGSWYYLGADNYVHRLNYDGASQNTESYSGYYPSFLFTAKFNGVEYNKSMALVQNVNANVSQTVKMRYLSTDYSVWIDGGDFTAVSGANIRNQGRAYENPVMWFAGSKFDTNCTNAGYNVCGLSGSGTYVCQSPAAVPDPAGTLCGNSVVPYLHDWVPNTEYRWNDAGPVPFGIAPFVSAGQTCSAQYVDNPLGSYTNTLLNNGFTGTVLDAKNFAGYWADSGIFGFYSSFPINKTPLENNLPNPDRILDLQDPAESVTYDNSAFFYFKSETPVSTFTVDNSSVASDPNKVSYTLSKIGYLDKDGNYALVTPNASLAPTGSVYGYTFPSKTKRFYVHFTKSVSDTSKIMAFWKLKLVYTSPSSATVLKYACADPGRSCQWSSANSCGKAVSGDYSCAVVGDYCRPTDEDAPYVYEPSHYPTPIGSGTVIQTNPVNVNVNPTINVQSPTVNVTVTGSTSGGGGTDTGFWSGIFGSGTVSDKLQGIADGVSSAVSSLGDAVSSAVSWIGEKIDSLGGSLSGMKDALTGSGVDDGTSGLGEISFSGETSFGTGYDISNLGAIGTGSASVSFGSGGKAGSFSGVALVGDRTASGFCDMFNPDGSFAYYSDGQPFAVTLSASGVIPLEWVQDNVVPHVDRAFAFVTAPVNNLGAVLNTVWTFPEGSKVCILGSVVEIRYQSSLKKLDDAKHFSGFQYGKMGFFDYLFLLVFGSLAVALFVRSLRFN